MDGVGDEEDGDDEVQYEERDEDEDVDRVGRRRSSMGCMTVDREECGVSDMVWVVMCKWWALRRS